MALCETSQRPNSTEVVVIRYLVVFFFFNGQFYLNPSHLGKIISKGEPHKHGANKVLTFSFSRNLLKSTLL